MAGVAGDVIARVEAEFRAEDLYGALVAFDLEVWSSAGFGAHTPQPCSDAGRRLARDKLRKGCHNLCQGLGLDISEAQWHAAARAALRVRNQQRAMENRMAWRILLDGGHLPRALEGAVRFYLSAWDGSGAVERGLGQDAAIMREHVGSKGREDLYSALLELKLEGPQTEACVFTSGEGGVLYLTDFSRRAAQLWVALHGRRFTCASTARKDTGQKAPPPQTRLTDKGVQHRARAAYQELCRTAAEDEAAKATEVSGEGLPRDTLFGIERKKLVVAVSRCEAVAPNPKTVRFRRATERLRAEKAAQQLWTGTRPDAPAARLGGALAVAARSRDAVMGASRALGWLRRRGKTVADPKRIPAPTSSVGPAASRASTPTQVAIHTSLDELFRQRTKDPSTKELEVWLAAVAKGGVVKTTRGETFVFTRSLKTSRRIHVGDEFCRKHKALHKALQNAVSELGSAWNMSTGSAAASSSSDGPMHHRIDDKRDFVEFLLRARRLQRQT